MNYNLVKGLTKGKIPPRELKERTKTRILDLKIILDGNRATDFKTEGLRKTLYVNTELWKRITKEEEPQLVNMSRLIH